MAPAPTDRRGSPFAVRLLRWYDANRRDLPWRRSRDPWAIWVSEVMLQQTRVEAVRAAFERFLQRFPTPDSFAAADDDTLLAAWRGLGYYRRARLLRDGARAVVERHGGRVPSGPDDLADLPGIGDYTRGAIASIAFGHPEPAIDGNVDRVAARHRGIAEALGTAPARRRIRDAVLGWLPPDRAGDFNQALMELGALVCTPAVVRCAACPVAADCVAHRDGRTAELPQKKPPRAAVAVDARVALVAGRRGCLGHRIPPGEPNHGQVELPGPGILRSIDAQGLAAAIRDRFGADLAIGPPLASVRHAITHHRITLHAHAGTATATGRLQWFPLDDQTPWTTPSRKVFRQVFADQDQPRA